jgi:hypothetical protein
MLNEGPVYTRITSSLREAGPSFCLSYYEPIRPPVSPIAIVGVSFEYSVCIHIKSDNTLRASPVLAATTLPGRRQAGLFSKPPSETVRKVLRARSRREFGQDREGEMG